MVLTGYNVSSQNYEVASVAATAIAAEAMSRLLHRAVPVEVATCVRLGAVAVANHKFSMDTIHDAVSVLTGLEEAMVAQVDGGEQTVEFMHVPWKSPGRHLLLVQVYLASIRNWLALRNTCRGMEYLHGRCASTSGMIAPPA